MDKSEIVYPDPGFWTKTSLTQLFYGIWANMSMISVGFAYSFSSILIPQLTESKGTESEITITPSEESLIVSVLTLATPVGCMLSGCLMDKYGRRIMLISREVPMIVGWMYIGFADTATKLIIGRLIVGLGCGIAVTAPRAYGTEISLPNMRGVIGALSHVMMSIGIAILAGLGAVLKWHVISFINGAYSIVMFLISFFFPESPYYLLMRENPETVKACLKKFRSPSYNVEAEMEQMLEYKRENDIRRLSYYNHLQAVVNPSAYKPFGIVFGYILIAQLSGASIVMMWTVHMLEHSKCNVDPHKGNFYLGIGRIFSAIMGAVLMLKVGRRPMALTSSFGVAMACFVLAFSIKYKSEPGLLPIFCYHAYITFACLGHFNMHILIMFELAPLQIRGLLGSLSISVLNIIMFCLNECYLPVVNSIGFSDTILAFGIMSFLGCFYFFFFLPETKDLTLQEIEEFYNERRSTLTSQRRLATLSMQSSSAMKSKSELNITPKSNTLGKLKK